MTSTHTRSLSPTEIERFLEHAACRGVAPSVFDADEYPNAWQAIKICSTCPRKARWACLQKIEPHKSWFDGVAGAMVWRNGIVQTIIGKTLHLSDESLANYFEERNPTSEDEKE
jgi:hypothetical protein